MNKENNIPKVIHYCWLGGRKKPVEVLTYIDNWKKKLPEYEIREWNESNFDIENSCKYATEAFKLKKWAFVSDYIRLEVLSKYGGIYLDTDVEVIKSFDDLLDLESFISSESEYSICTAVIGAVPEAKWIKKVLKLYNERGFIIDDKKIDTTPNSQYLYEFFNKEYHFSKSTLKSFHFDGSVILPSDYFSPINYNTRETNVTSNTYAIHHYSGAWKTSSEKIKDVLLAFVTRIIGEKRREKIKRYLKRIEI